MRLPRRPRAVAALLMVIGAAMPLRGDEGPPEIDPTGGLRSRAAVPQGPTLGVSREELVRQWDLDGNGTIDASEANVARARMRRARIETELGTGIDPLTGKPRVVADPMTEESPEDAAASGAELPPEARVRSADADAPPGTRVPGVGPVVSGTAGPRVPSITSTGSTAPGRGAGTRPTVTGPTSRSSRPGSLTGGTRAGAPAARSGYGAAERKPDLNAALPRRLERPALSGTGSTRGGFMPSVRSPVAPRPAPLVPTTPRVTADEIGGF
ncbi:MAG: hypothetical protein ACKO40_08980 [Planctomycetaceae bacterium]